VSAADDEVSLVIDARRIVDGRIVVTEGRFQDVVHSGRVRGIAARLRAVAAGKVDGRVSEQIERVSLRSEARGRIARLLMEGEEASISAGFAVAAVGENVRAEPDPRTVGHGARPQGVVVVGVQVEIPGGAAVPRAGPVATVSVHRSQRAERAVRVAVDGTAVSAVPVHGRLAAEGPELAGTDDRA